MSAWTDLPPEILALLLDRLPRFRDRCRFRSVCRPWRRAESQQPQLPFLALPLSTTDYTNGFLSLAGGDLSALILPRQARNARCCGSAPAGGWLAMNQPEHGNFLLNPFTRAVIPLPRRAHRHHRGTPRWRVTVHKAVMSAAPTASGCIVAAIAGIGVGPADDNLFVAVCRPGGRSWFRDADRPFRPADIALVGSKVYAIASLDEMLVLEIADDEGSPMISCVRKVTTKHPGAALLLAGAGLGLSPRPRRAYFLMQSSLRGKLVAVVKTGTDMEAFELDDVSNSMLTWRRVERFEKEVLFVSAKSSMAFPADHYYGFHGGFVYLADGFCESYTSKDWKMQRRLDVAATGIGVRVFAMQDKNVTSYVSSGSGLPPPTWLFLTS